MTNKPRWNRHLGAYANSPDVDIFLSEVQSLCKRHQLSISHEDCQGAFEVRHYHEKYADWLGNAHDSRVPDGAEYEKLTQFLEKAGTRLLPSASWLSFKRLNVYCRALTRANAKKVFVVANIEVDESYRKQGVFTKWLADVEQLVKAQGFSEVVIENVLNDVLEPFLLSKGYAVDNADLYPVSYSKPLNVVSTL